LAISTRVRGRRRVHGFRRHTTTAINDLDDFRALEPFFRAIEAALSGLADGDNFFDLLADDVVFEYFTTVSGYPRRVVGRSAVVDSRLI
jgi:uncharacterized protein